MCIIHLKVHKPFELSTWWHVYRSARLFYSDKSDYFSFIHQYSALEAGLAGTRAQSCDRCGSGTLHPGQVLGGSLSLLFYL